MVNLFFNPHGRIAGGPFWLGVIVLLVISLALTFVSSTAPQNLRIVIGLASLVLIYPSLCVYSKRLHESGKSAWWYLAIIVLSFVVSIVLGIVLAAPHFAEFARVEPNSPEFVALQEQIQQEARLPSLIVTVALSLIIAALVDMLKRDPEENKYGPPATSG